MSDLPYEAQETEISPWTHIALDIVGPYWVKSVVKKKETRNTVVKMKVFPVLYTCLLTRAIHVTVALGYSTEDMILAFKDFVSLRGLPETVYSDAGNQLIKAGKVLADKEEGEINWEGIHEMTAKNGVKWTTAPPYAQFRNGKMESLVKIWKATIHHLAGNGDVLNYVEFQGLLREACSIVNDRPISYRKHNGAEGGFQPITPNMLLLTSRAKSPPPSLEEFNDIDDKCVRKLRFRESCLRDWWNDWYSTVFDQLFIRPKWKHHVRNVMPGDIVVMRNTGKLAPGDYRRGRVTRADPDKDGKVRTVHVQMYRPDARRKVDHYQGEGHVQVRLAVQRLVVLVPVEEQGCDDPSVADAGSEGVVCGEV